MKLTIEPPDDGIAACFAVAWTGIALSRVRCLTCGTEFYCRTNEARQSILDGHYLDAARTHSALCHRKDTLDNSTRVC